MCSDVAMETLHTPKALTEVLILDVWRYLTCVCVCVLICISMHEYLCFLENTE